MTALLVWKLGFNEPLVYHDFKAVLNGAVSFFIVSRMAEQPHG